MPSPSTVRAPLRARRGKQRRVARVVHEVGDDLSRAEQRPDRTAARRVPMPTDVALTTMSASRSAVLVPTEPTPRPAAPPCRHARRDRLTTAIAGRAGAASASMTARPRPRHRAPRSAPTDRHILRGQRRDEPGTVGAVPLQPSIARRHDGVDAAQRRRRRIELVDQRGDVLLVRHRDRQPTEPQRAHRVERRTGAPGATSNAVYTQSSPSAANAGVVQRRRQAVAHRAADDRGDRVAPVITSRPASRALLRRWPRAARA